MMRRQRPLTPGRGTGRRALLGATLPVVVGVLSFGAGAFAPAPAGATGATEGAGGAGGAGAQRRFAPLPDARLVGQGTLTWFGLRIYHARLWTTATQIMPDRPADAEFALELEYARSLKGSDIAGRSADEMERLGRGDPASRDRWRDRMRGLFPDVKRGDRIAGVNQPGRGARFYLNDGPLGSVDEPDFAEAFFAIWFDPKTTDPGLRSDLLGRRGSLG